MRIWIKRVDPDHIANALSILSQAERVRADGMTSRSRGRFIIGRALLRRELAAVLGLDPADMILTQPGAGRVVLDHVRAADVGFSVAHTAVGGDDYVAVAVASAPVGIDIEWTHRTLDIPRMTARRFSPHDRDRVLALSGETQRRSFFALWTLKEAVVKWSDGKLLDIMMTTAFDMSGSRPALCQPARADLLGAQLFSSTVEDIGLMLGCAATEPGPPSLHFDARGCFEP